MKKPLILNPIIQRRNIIEQNNNYKSSISSSKAIINYSCPESYKFYESHFKGFRKKDNSYSEYKRLYDNRLLYYKLDKISTSPNKKFIEYLKPLFEFDKNRFNCRRLLEKKALREENALYKKKINDMKSIYSVPNWEKSYRKTQYIKQMRCLAEDNNYGNNNSKNNDSFNGNDYQTLYYNTTKFKAFKSPLPKIIMRLRRNETKHRQMETEPNERRHNSNKNKSKDKKDNSDKKDEEKNKGNENANQNDSGYEDNSSLDQNLHDPHKRNQP